MGRSGSGGRVYFGLEDVGLPVMRVQQELQSELISHWSPARPGVLCRTTANKLTAWQEANQVPETGAVDRSTWMLMFGESAPPIQSRIFSAAAWMLGLSAVGRVVDPCLGLRWGYWGLSIRSGALQKALGALDAIPSPDEDELISRVFSLSNKSQVAFWTACSKRKTGWLPQDPSMEAQRVQYERAKELWGDLPDDLTVTQEREVELARRVLPRVLADCPDPTIIGTWKLGDIEGMQRQLEELDVFLEKGLVPKRKGGAGWFQSDGRNLVRFGIG